MWQTGLIRNCPPTLTLKVGRTYDNNDARILAVPIAEAQVSVVYQVFPEDRQLFIVRLLFQKLAT